MSCIGKNPTFNNLSGSSDRYEFFKMNSGWNVWKSYDLNYISHIYDYVPMSKLNSRNVHESMPFFGKNPKFNNLGGSSDKYEFFKRSSR